MVESGGWILEENKTNHQWVCTARAGEDRCHCREQVISDRKMESRDLEVNGPVTSCVGQKRRLR